MLKKDDENDLLSCVINSSPAAACLSLQRLDRRSLDIHLQQALNIDKEQDY